MAKSKPHTIRFEEKDFEFICKRENLKTAQNVVSFLLNEYIKLYKVEKKSVFSAEQKDEYLENKVNYSKITPESYEGAKTKRYEADEANMWQEAIKDYSYYERLGKKVEFDNAEVLIIEIMAAPLLKNWQKPMLQKMINERFF